MQFIFSITVASLLSLTHASPITSEDLSKSAPPAQAVPEATKTDTNTVVVSWNALGSSGGKYITVHLGELTFVSALAPKLDILRSSKSILTASR